MGEMGDSTDGEGLEAHLSARWEAIASAAETLHPAPLETIQPTTGPLSVSDLRQLRAGATDRVRVGELIASGGMGAVHAAHQLALNRSVAVKQPLPGRQRTGDVGQKLLQEAWVTGALEHPNILPIYDIEIGDGGTPSIVMKRIHGEPWSALMLDEAGMAEREGADLLEWNLRVLMDVANALRFAHAQGIVHLDLKPSNVMIGRFGEVYLLDWGIARSLERDEDGRFPLASAIDSIIGTPAYLAPEMLACDGSLLSERTDVYLLGASLYEVLTGRTPHAADTLMTMFYKAVNEVPTLPASVPAGLAAICTRALQFDPEDRYPSADAFRLALQDYLRHRGSLAIGEEARAQLEAGNLAEARAGFRQALIAWEDNPDAHRRLEELDVLDAAERERIASLERLEDDLDLRQGRTTRAVIYSTLGLIWTLFPLVRAAAGSTGMTHAGRNVTTLSFLVMALGVGIAGRKSLRTRVNRQIYALLIIVLTVQLAQSIAFGLADADITVRIPIVFLNWAAGGLVAAALIDRRTWPMALGYLAGAVITSHDVSTTTWAMAAANAVFALNVAFLWAPWGRRDEPATRSGRPPR